MNVNISRFLLIAAILTAVGLVIAGGVVASRAYADTPWGSGWCGNWDGWGLLGRGMMGGWGDWGEFCPLFDDNSRPGSDDEARTDRAPLSLEDVEAKVETFLREQDDNLVLAEVMEFSNHFYAEAVEKDTGFGALEVLIDRYTGKIYPEMGPNMMWNDKYGMMGGRRGMMMGSRWRENRTPDPAKMPITPDEAVQQAQEYLADQDTGLTIDPDDVTTFYGYYTLHTLKDGKPEGMLSVNGYSGRVWYHSWHGDFVRMSEHEEQASGHAEAGQDLTDNGADSAKSSGYIDISPSELRAMSRSKDFMLINVHVPYEGELRYTDLFIPYNEIRASASQLPADKDARIVVYCRSGSMSQSAARDLVELGYTNVYHLAGGMLAWKDAGYELLQKVE